MKLSARTVSSPGCVDKFPPRIMRFHLTKPSAHSRRGLRSRPSPIFVKQRTSVAVTAGMKEPSSPKVTCMGQVRVRRSKQGTRKKDCRPGRQDRCRWIPRVLFYRSSKGGGVGVRFSLFWRCIPSWPKCVSFFRFGRRGGSQNWRFNGKDEDFGHRPGEMVEEDDDDDEEVIEGKVNCLGSSPCSPPKNALILTRCRSAPYTSSSLACRFWGSPLDAEMKVIRMSTNQQPKTARMGSENGGLEEEDGEWKETDYIRNHDRGIETGHKHEQEPQNSNGTGPPVWDMDGVARSESSAILRAGGGESVAVQPLMLTRCKSEPGRTGENTRLGIVDS